MSPSVIWLRADGSMVLWRYEAIPPASCHRADGSRRRPTGCRSAPDASERRSPWCRATSHRGPRRRPTRRRITERRACHRPVGTSGSLRTAPTRGDPWRGSLAPGEATSSRDDVADATEPDPCYSLGVTSLTLDAEPACPAAERSRRSSRRRRPPFASSDARSPTSRRATWDALAARTRGRPRSPAGPSSARGGTRTARTPTRRRSLVPADAPARRGARSRSSRSCTATRSSRATR